ncbi:MAG: diflavin flavoprotein [Pegethrix bostrychoides GSE-TBD4-15B]|jgi:flavorubredoxin/flavin reductase (DIM6/NTAB) family NADH-FMN oxidoreductase RutF|uniref:Diflavin flavoprotein n=1 Tax=Pegethrix bostrychoides GSE-TBD4-15B TaxID=2839662 RepID=A0A951P6G4_9CYAN|nr:diflavin flavoprotein [Pegethrix bostrychoides GSE-TBD4-15B]
MTEVVTEAVTEAVTETKTTKTEARPKTKQRDVQVAEIGAETLVFRSRSWTRLRFEVEYARQKGTTANSYLIQATDVALIDPPGESFTDSFLEELQQQQYYQRIDYIILSHVNPNRIATLKQLLAVASYATVICSKPAANLLRASFAQEADNRSLPESEALDFGIQYDAERSFKLHVVHDEEILDLGGGHQLQFRYLPTPRHPDQICTYDAATGILFSDKLFGAHVCSDELWDAHWRQLSEDRRYYFDCLHAAQAPQIETALQKLELFQSKLYAPAHGPIVRHSLSRLTLDYRDWAQQQQNRELSVALLYTSAYGNTGQLAQAIAQGITQAGLAVQTLNCEYAPPSEIARAIEETDGFVIGSPTLGGHAPVQIQTALGIALSTATKSKLAGVFGSYGWSGEAVDLLETKLQDAGYRFGFEPIRVKFAPTAEVLQQCETAGTEFAQTLRKIKKIWTPRQQIADAKSDRTEQAVGRIAGSLCVITTHQNQQHQAILTSWVSQASFNPPGLTIAVSKEHAATLADSGNAFVLNILKEGRNIRRHFFKPLVAKGDRFEQVESYLAGNGCLVLQEGLAYLECSVQSRMECGDHWLIYATVESGKLLEALGITAVQHRKSASYF